MDGGSHQRVGLQPEHRLGRVGCVESVEESGHARGLEDCYLRSAAEVLQHGVESLGGCEVRLARVTSVKFGGDKPGSSECSQ